MAAASAETFPKSIPGAGAVGVGGPGLMYFLKENGITVPPAIVTLVGIVSAIALLVAAVQFVGWLWRSAKEQSSNQNSRVFKLQSSVRRNLFPLMLSVMAIAGVLLIAGAVAGAVHYYREPKIRSTQPSTGELIDGPIKWTPHYLLGGRQTERGVDINSFQMTGENVSDEFVGKLSGFVRSDVTGKQFPLLVLDRSDWLPIEGFGIPAKHQFHITSRFVAPPGGMPPSQFLQDFGRLTFQFDYDGKTYKKSYTSEEIQAEVRRVEADLKPPAHPSMAGVRRIEPAVSAPPLDQPSPKPRPHYDAKEIGEMLATLRALDSIIDKKYAPARQSLSDILANWETRVRADLSNIRIEEIQTARDQLVSARTDILRLFDENAFYKAELQPVTVGENNANSSMQSALDQFIRDVRALARFNGDGIDLLHFANPALNRLESENDKMRKWIPEVKAAISSKTTELREWKTQ